MLTFILILLLVGILCLWLYGFWQANDLVIPTKKTPNYKKILVIFPHADDEALFIGGLLRKFSGKGASVEWIILTHGENGTEGAILDESLKETRKKEANSVANIYKIDKPTILNYPDGDVQGHKEKLESDLKKRISNINPELIITYDESGLYGHPDHIATAEVITQLLNDEFNDIRLWYVSNPKKLLDHIKLPEEMANDLEFKEKRKSPNMKTWVGVGGVISKIRAVYLYKSQFDTIVKGFPIKQIPVWFYISLTPYEYFYEVK